MKEISNFRKNSGTLFGIVYTILCQYVVMTHSYPDFEKNMSKHCKLIPLI